VRLGRDEQDVVEGESLLGELPVQGQETLQFVLAELDIQGRLRVTRWAVVPTPS
jgi:hypothetical protein